MQVVICAARHDLFFVAKRLPFCCKHLDSRVQLASLFHYYVLIWGNGLVIKSSDGVYASSCSVISKINL
jgi:hypothetical protein